MDLMNTAIILQGFGDSSANGSYLIVTIIIINANMVLFELDQSEL